jgi:hypothetical protein
MKVKELIAQLHTFAPDMEVFCYSEDEALLPPGHGSRLLKIEEISTEDGVKARGEDNVSYLQPGQSPDSKIYILLEVTTDF